MRPVQLRGSFYCTRHAAGYSWRSTETWVLLHTKGIQIIWRYTSVVITVSGWAGGDIQVIVVGPGKDRADLHAQAKFLMTI